MVPLLWVCAGSPVYAAPEVLRKKYNTQADMWSAGIIAYMLLTARLPWHGNWGVGVAELYAGRTHPPCAAGSCSKHACSCMIAAVNHAQGQLDLAGVMLWRLC